MVKSTVEAPMALRYEAQFTQVTSAETIRPGSGSSATPKASCRGTKALIDAVSRNTAPAKGSRPGARRSTCSAPTRSFDKAYSPRKVTPKFSHDRGCTWMPAVG